ncbi:thioesterase II family protein [Streptomyces lancefieldiae]|uniref:Alpha/beta fold hydrolase n=1 Tax=Streptomyces lancefieldiae TaxID=3075520 RepID=A0ABU3B2H6_9ACTN|nr:alpha/beta fold hydrolase [Streptomyces sp. DSM 40712]MDT0616368.1 alpha/beta fold hydrolase [Streptomyces sp. DSM 40712]
MSSAAHLTGLWLRSFHPSPKATARLVCLPHAGGSASYFFPVSKALSPDVEVLAVQYPGRQDRRGEPCLESVDELADHVARDLGALTDRPLALFGHSMGASVAFEVARRLAGTDVPLLGLIASGRSAPSSTWGADVHLRDDAGILRELRELSGTDARLFDDEELLRMILPAVRGDYTAVARYRCAPGVRIACPVSVLVGDADPQVPPAQAERWRDHTDGAFDLRVFPGGHFYLNERADEVTAAIADRVARWSAAAARTV